MSKLEELIQQYCPDGVEYKALKTILRIKNGKDYKHLNEGDIPVYGSGGVMTYVDTPMYDKPSVLIPRKGSIDKLYYVDTPFWNVDTVFYTEIDAKQVIEKYVFYTLQKEHLEKLNTAGGVPSLTQGVVNEVLIPVPPLPVQEEIVRILNSFTELQAELQAELQKRKQQYNYYLDNLLSFNRGGQTEVKWMKLSEVAQVCRGTRVVKSQLSNKGYPVYQNCLTPMGYYDKANCKGGTPFVICGGAAGNVGYSIVDYWAADDCEYIVSGLEVCNKYLYYYLMTKQDYLSSQVRKASVPRLSPIVIKDLVIPIPSLDEQQRIVSILDRFDTLTTDLTAGLPAEIEKRRQQYEYYRDKLLTFKRKGA